MKIVLIVEIHSGSVHTKRECGGDESHC